MSVQKLQEQMIALQNKKAELEREAISLEQASKQKRAERDDVKDQLSQTISALGEFATINKATEAAEAAKAAAKHAETHAASLIELKTKWDKALSDVQAKIESELAEFRVFLEKKKAE